MRCASAESRASRRRTSAETGIVACTWEARSSASAARCNHLGSGDDDVTHCLIRLTSAAASAPGLGSRQVAGSKAGQRAQRAPPCSDSQAHSAERGSVQRWIAARSSTGQPWTERREGPHSRELLPRRRLPLGCSPDHPQGSPCTAGRPGPHRYHVLSATSRFRRATAQTPLNQYAPAPLSCPPSRSPDPARPPPPCL